MDLVKKKRYLLFFIHKKIKRSFIQKVLKGSSILMPFLGVISLGILLCTLGFFIIPIPIFYLK